MRKMIIAILALVILGVLNTEREVCYEDFCTYQKNIDYLLGND